ncbi:unnamed protein product [Ilex paraguariensis]|uniref:Uncharacterized protein n=1 Tax=Ilex paraguariensis TaxID=185542 RepID=A0ABC8U6N2_9AQUA
MVLKSRDSTNVLARMIQSYHIHSASNCFPFIDCVKLGQNTGNMAPDTGTNFSSYDTVPLHSDGDIDNLLNFPNSDLELVENHGLESLADQQTVHAAVVPSEDPAEMGR